MLLRQKKEKETAAIHTSLYFPGKAANEPFEKNRLNYLSIVQKIFSCVPESRRLRNSAGIVRTVET